MGENRQYNPARIVYMYSMEVQGRIAPDNPAYRLSTAIAEDRPSLENLADPWAAFFQPTDLVESRRNDITAVIAVQSEKLRKTWVKFQEQSDPSDRLDLETANPTMEGITKLVSQGMQSWTNKRKSGRHGAVSTKFHKFCGAVDSHKSLLKVLPESHEYFSLFMGSVTAVVKASVNHETVVENLAHALEDMTDLIQDSERDLMLFPNDEMTTRVVELYTGIFRFLENSLEWMIRARHKRAADAFNENLSEMLQKDIAEVKAKSQRIRLFATQSGLADGRITRHRVEGIDKDVQHLREDNARMAATIEEMRDSHRELAKLLQRHLLIPQAKAWADQQRLTAEAQQRRLSWQSASSIFSIEDVTEEHPTHKGNIQDEASQVLDGCFDKDRVKLIPEGFHVSSIPPDMLQNLINWLEDEAEASSFIWLQGPTTLAEDHDNPMSMLAAKYIEIAREIKLRGGKPMPLISYFCNISRQRPREGNPTREAQGVIALAYALLRQLITELQSSPPAVQTQGLFGRLEQHISSLDGTIRTWDGALSALAEAAGFVPLGTLCVVDGVHWLDGRDTERLLCDLVRCLRSSGLKTFVHDQCQVRCALGGGDS